MTQQHQRTCAAFRDVHKDPVRLDNAMLHASHSRPERFVQTSALTAGLRRKRGARENGISRGFSAPTVHPNREDRCLPVDTSECRSKPPKINEYRPAALDFITMSAPSIRVDFGCLTTEGSEGRSRA
jgi:hypothetical protein